MEDPSVLNNYYKEETPQTKKPSSLLALKQTVFFVTCLASPSKHGNLQLNQFF